MSCNHFNFYDFQSTVLECLKDRCDRGIDIFKKEFGVGTFIISGGVASNMFIRKGMKNLAEKKNMMFHVPEPRLCVDNASMIAWAGIEKINCTKKSDPIDTLPKPRWPLNNL